MTEKYINEIPKIFFEKMVFEVLVAKPLQLLQLSVRLPGAGFGSCWPLLRAVKVDALDCVPVTIFWVFDRLKKTVLIFSIMSMYISTRF